MQARRYQKAPPLLTLTKTAGNFVAASDGLTIVIPADQTTGLVPPTTATGNPPVSFVYDIELLQAGVVVERLAQGTGYIVPDTTRATE